jgi:microsomal dipeptidase-like Zn-dependent dipeptidase
VSNEALCRNNIKVNTVDCSKSMASIDDQLLAAQTFQSWLDGQYGGPGQGWFQIVKTPQQAQTVINQGKLAVVLGIEVDNIFNCHLTKSDGTPLNGEGPTCDNTYILAQLQNYFAQGVRYIFPVHDFDNAFGKTATWSDAINAGQLEGEGAWQDATNCPSFPIGQGYGFGMNAGFDQIIFGIAFDQGFLFGPKPSYPSIGFPIGSCSNGTGTGSSAPITPAGNYLIQQAMNMGFIIDVDHMSIDGFKTTLNIATQPAPTGYRYPVPYAGISASHVQFFDLYHQFYQGASGAGRHERMRTFAQLQQIAGVGGMIGVMLKDDAQDTANGWCLPQANCSLFGGKLGPLNETGTDFTYNYNGSNAPFNNNGLLQQNCLYSTTETAEQYLYGVKAMSLLQSSGQFAVSGGVALGSDFMGIAGHPGPRFGNGACGGNRYEQALQGFAQNKLQYPFTLAGITFDKQVSGQKTYDFNVDGLAHIGLFPDMIKDMEMVHVFPSELQPLFSSAQAYVNMWSAVYQAPAPTVTMSGVPTTPAPWQSTFTVTTSNNGTTTSVPTITASGACSISGKIVTMTSGTGTCSVTATWASDGYWAAATITQSVAAATIPQTVSFFQAPQSAPYKSTFRFLATTNASEQAMISTTGPCQIDGGFPTYIPPSTSDPTAYTSGVIDMTGGTGTCVLTVSITSTSVDGNLTVQGNTSTVLLSANTVSGNLQVQDNTDAAKNATQVLNNQVGKNLLCSGNASITGQGNTAKSKQGQCATF